ncbi:MAG: PspC domain-containing protein [Eubacteriaceae bacterium]|nr:PspC domain-containing protein [Eubacteriaceae bacterium]MDD4507398.1 PspC domain-containing protein [Eubacteriaceae bacterium]
MKKKLLRDKAGGIVAGVCQGLGTHFNLPPWLFRVAFIIPALPFVLNTASTVLSFVVYLVLAMIMKDKSKIAEDDKKIVDTEYEVVDDSKEEKT